MGIENIATGYKPEFALGALYHGFNAGSADNASQLSNLIQEQALQKSRIGDPLDLIKKQYEAMVANAQMNNPNYIPAQMQGDMGKFASSAAKGKIDSSSVDEQIKALLAELAQKTGKSNLLSQFQGQQQADINAIGNVPQEQPQPIQQQQPQQSTGPLGSRLRQMATILGTTPEHLNRMEEIKAQGDSRLEIANIAAQARLQAVHDAQQKGDTTKVAELNLAAKNDAEAGRYEALINKQDIARQEREILEKIVDKTKQKAAIAELSASVRRYEQLAKAYRDQANVIYKKHGLSVPTSNELVPAPAQAPTGVIKLD